MPEANEKAIVLEDYSSIRFGPGNIMPNFTNAFLPMFESHIIGNYMLLTIISALIALYWLSNKRMLVQGFFMLSASLSLLFFYLNNVYYADWYNVTIFAYLFFVFGILFSTLVGSKNAIIQISSAILFGLIILVASSNSIVSINKEVRDYYYLTTKAPEILEKAIPKECVVITPYAPNVKMGTNINAINSVEAVKNMKMLQDYSCMYFFEDYLCHLSRANSGMKEDCDFFKENYKMRPELVIGKKKSSLEYALY